MKKRLLFIAILSMCSMLTFGQAKLLEAYPKHYVCYRTNGSIILDGLLNEPSWQNVPWTDHFLDIEGLHMPKPYYNTRAKMLWDDDYFYIAAELEEPHLWATYTERESVIFHENDFEVFIDPNGDTHTYYELELNALGTLWDLFLTKPYLNDGIPMNAWDIAGFEFGIKLRGTLNNPTDTDTSWTVEMAFPWNVLKEFAFEKRKPNPKEQWRVNFSRVQWRLDIVDGEYVKTINPKTGEFYPEHNWVWLPQWTINMHRPEYWGYVQFSALQAGSGTDGFIPNPDEPIKFVLRELYYRQLAYWEQHNRYATRIDELDIPSDFIKDRDVDFEVSRTRFKLSTPSADGESVWYITDDSRIWKE
jgi:hypothetical protein